MAAPKISVLCAQNMADELTALLDVETTAASVKIYSGAGPADLSVTATGTLLATLTMSVTSFAAAIDGTPGGDIVANAIADETSAVAGTAGYFRLQDSAATPIEHFQGDITATGGGGDLELNSVAISAGATVSISAMTLTMRET